ncbi:MAG: CooT family nickel-binding protein [Desulfarculus sp.]|nr:CooT family nickel-binding protein [Desulfarculus sp.]
MCEASAYLLMKSGDEELLLADVDLVEPQDDGQIRLVSIYGDQKVVKAEIKSMSLVNHRMVFVEP